VPVGCQPDSVFRRPPDRRSAGELHALDDNGHLVDSYRPTMFWVIVDKLGPVLALAALLAPFVLLVVGVVHGSRRADRGEPETTGTSALRGFGLGILAAPVLLWFALCSPPPGEGVLPREGYQRGAVVINALERFRHDHGHYPDSLAVLAPALLDADVLDRPTGSQQHYSWEYRRRAPDAFVLSFRYVGPGMNECRIGSAERRWSCSGYY
jgi:hypothetical protein